MDGIPVLTIEERKFSSTELILSVYAKTGTSLRFGARSKMFDNVLHVINEPASDNRALIIENFIGGHFKSTKDHIDSYDPSTGKVWAKVPDSGATEIDQAVQAARDAFTHWSKETARKRSQYLNRIADLIENDLETFAIVESKDQGKTVAMARTVDIPRAVLNFRFFASVILHEKNE